MYSFPKTVWLFRSFQAVLSICTKYQLLLQLYLVPAIAIGCLYLEQLRLVAST